MNSSQWLLGAGLLASCALAHALDYTAGAIAIGQPYARATAAGQMVGGGYFKLQNKGKADDKLLAVSADVSETVELHTMIMDGDVARMREVSGIDVPAGKTVELKPGGLHVMFMGLKAPLKVGAQFPATLKFEKAGSVMIEFQVQAIEVKPHGH